MYAQRVRLRITASHVASHFQVDKQVLIICHSQFDLHHANVAVPIQRAPLFGVKFIQ